MRRWLLPFGVAFALASCRQLVGIEEHATPPEGAVPDAGVPGPACGLAVSAGACRECAERSCCEPLRACGADPACASYEQCSLGCARDPECESRCFVNHPIGIRATPIALDACLATSCAGECAVGCGSSPNVTPQVARECRACGNANVCDDLLRCTKNVDCFAIQRCKEACTTPDCTLACEDTQRPGYEDWRKAVNVGLGFCANACGLGGSWSCVDHVTWPTAKAKELSVNLTVTRYGTPIKMPDVKVKACRARIAGCDPIAQATTDANGNVTLKLPADFGAVGPMPFFELTSASTIPFLIYPSFPFSEPNARFLTTQDVFDQATLDVLASQIGATPDPTRGHLALFAWDCFLVRAKGVSFTVTTEVPNTGLDEKSTAFYARTTRLVTDATETDAEGLGGFVNVRPGTVTIIATPKSLGKPSSIVTAVVRPGTVTLVNAQPQAQ